MTKVSCKTEMLFDGNSVLVKTKDKALIEKLENFCNVYPDYYQRIQGEDGDYYSLPERDVYLKLIHH